MQAAAVGRVDDLHLHALALQLATGKPRIGAALGAVAVQHVDAELGGELGDFCNRAPVVKAERAGHGNSGQAKSAIVAQTTELHGDFIAAGARIAHHADFRPKLCLSQGKIVHMAEQAADRRAQAMQDAKRGAHEDPFRNLGRRLCEL